MLNCEVPNKNMYVKSVLQSVEPLQYLLHQLNIMFFVCQGVNSSWMKIFEDYL